MILSTTHPRFIFFGTPEFARITLDELALRGMLPVLVITAPDAPRGRKLILTESPVSQWADAHNIPVLKPATLKDALFAEKLASHKADLFVVAAYGKLIPKSILEIPKHGALNVHPSLLPLFRGATPIESAILSDETYTGVTIMLLDEEMDHGPVLAQRERIINVWPPKIGELTRDLAHFGGALLADIIPEWIGGLTAYPQDHTRATFTKKITKEDGLIDMAGDARRNYKKICALANAHFFVSHNERKIRVRITDATLDNDTLTITRVIPEGKKEMPYADFLRGLHDTP